MNEKRVETITLTLELPDDLAERVAAMDPERRQRFAVAALEEFREEEDDEAEGYRLTLEGVATVEEALADIAAGKFHRFDLEEEKREAREVIAQHVAARGRR